MSKSLVFVSARKPESKLTFDTVMSEAKNATVGMYFLKKSINKIK